MCLGEKGGGLFGSVLDTMALQEPIMGKIWLHGMWTAHSLKNHTLFGHLHSALSADAAILRRCLCGVFKFFCF